MDIGVKGEGNEAKIVGVRGRAVDRVNKGRLGPKGLSFHHEYIIDLSLMVHRVARLGK